MDGGSLAGTGFYPERKAQPAPFLDRLLAGAGFRLHNAVARRLAEAPLLAAEVRRHAAHFRGRALAPRLAGLRYRLRRDGFRAELVRECFGAYCAALPEGDAERPAPHVLAAACWLVEGGVAELSDAADRRQALALAAFARALQGGCVHLLSANERSARRLAEEIGAPFTALGIAVGCIAPGMDAAARRNAYACPVVCAAHREVALDYLRDQAHSAARAGAMLSTLERLSGYAPAAGQLLLRGLRCALVDEADLVLLDDAKAPLVIAKEADQSQERLMYEQAVELARALEAESGPMLREDGAALTEPAAKLLGRLVTPLGGVWVSRERREELVLLALEALYRLERGVDYQVEQGRVVLAEPPAQPGAAQATQADPAHAARGDVLRKLIEVKEGCRIGSRRDVIARMSVTSFFGRYLHLGGACADARGLERQFWTLYSLKSAFAGWRAAPVSPPARVFVTAEAKRAALIEAVRAHAAAGRAVLVAVRSPAQAQAVERSLAEAGLSAATLRGRGDELERQGLAGLERPGGIAVTLFPAENAVPRAAPAAAPRAAPTVPPRFLLVAELHDARRHIARIYEAYGASAGETLLALEDETVAAALGKAAARAARLFAGAGGELSARGSAWVAGLAQRNAERTEAMLLLDILSRDQYLNDLLAFSGQGP